MVREIAIFIAGTALMVPPAAAQASAQVSDPDSHAAIAQSAIPSLVPDPSQNSADPATPPDPAPEDAGTEAMLPHFKNTRFWLSGQANFIFQTHPPFPALYSGTHSLGPDY